MSWPLPPLLAIRVTWANCKLGNFGKRIFDGLQLHKDPEDALKRATRPW